MFGFSQKRMIKGQSILEYVLLISMVALILGAMTPMVRRSIQSVVKTTADQLRPQNEADQSVNEAGLLDRSITVAKTRNIRSVVPMLSPDGISYGDILYVTRDKSSEMTNSVVNLGFTNTIIVY